MLTTIETRALIRKHVALTGGRINGIWTDPVGGIGHVDLNDSTRVITVRTEYPNAVKAAINSDPLNVIARVTPEGYLKVNAILK